MKKTITFLILFAGLCMQVFAYDFVSGGIYYKIIATGVENKVKVTYSNNTSYNSYSGSVTVPSSVTYNSVTYTVTEIDSAAFAASTSLTSVSLPNTIEKIDSSAFVLCTSLSSINIPSGVRYIGSAAFGQTAIRTITIPENVTFLGGGMFWGCSLLTTVNYDARNATHGRYYDEDLGFALTHNFTGCSSLTTVNIGTNVTSIPRAYFIGAVALTSVTIPDAVTSIGDSAFAGCISLANLQIGRNVATIGDYAFAQTGLASIVSKATVPPTLSVNTFSGISNSIPLTIPCGTTNAYRTHWANFNNVTEDCNFVLTVASNDPMYGSTTGSGTYASGTTVQIAAIPAQGFVFTKWNDDVTSNPRSITITSDTTFTAIFDFSEGIEDAEAETIYVISGNSEITACNLQDGVFSIFDLSGRCLVNHDVTKGSSVKYRVPATGVYVVRNNGRSIKVFVK